MSTNIRTGFVVKNLTRISHRRARKAFLLRFFGMVQTAQILGNIDLWLCNRSRGKYSDFGLYGRFVRLLGNNRKKKEKKRKEKNLIK